MSFSNSKTLVQQCESPANHSLIIELVTPTLTAPWHFRADLKIYWIHCEISYKIPMIDISFKSLGKWIIKTNGLISAVNKVLTWTSSTDVAHGPRACRTGTRWTTPRSEPLSGRPGPVAAGVAAGVRGAVQRGGRLVGGAGGRVPLSLVLCPPRPPCATSRLSSGVKAFGS